MEMLSSFVGLIIAFIIVMVILSLCLIKSKINIFLKVFLISISIWYSLVLFFVPYNFTGWPTFDKPPYESAVLSFLIRQPTYDNPGTIYLVLVDYSEYVKEKQRGFFIDLIPKISFHYQNNAEPRLYKLPYTKELHKKLTSEEVKDGACMIIESPCSDNPRVRVDDPKGNLRK